MIRQSLITLNDPKAPASEAYRMIRTNLEYTNVDKENKTILFTSAKTKEGKSTTIVNVAATMAHNDKKVIVLDCDLRKPRMHKLFQVSNELGITSVIAKNYKLDEVVQCIDELPNLHLITCGPIPPMPSELLSSEKMQNVLDELAKRYDYVLVDTPPVLSVTDAAQLASKVDGLILNVAIGETQIEAIQRAKKSLEKVGANILGVILTKAETNKKGYYYYYHYDYNYKTETKKKKKKSPLLLWK